MEHQLLYKFALVGTHLVHVQVCVGSFGRRKYVGTLTFNRPDWVIFSGCAENEHTQFLDVGASSRGIPTAQAFP